MIKELHLENFKGFNDTQKIPLKPITLLYGPNSAGKSTIIQSLLLLGQSQNESDMESSALLPKGKFLNLGNYREMVYAHESERKISFRIAFKVDSERFLYTEVTNYIKEISYDIQFYYNEDNQQIRVYSIKLYCNNEEKPFFRVELCNTNDFVIHRAWRFPRNVKDDEISLYEVVDFNEGHPIVQHAYKNFCDKMEKRKMDLEKQIARMSKRMDHFYNSTETDYYRNEIEKIKEKINLICNYSKNDYLADLKVMIDKQLIILNSYYITGFGEKGKNEDEDKDKETNSMKFDVETFDIEDLLISVSFNLKEIIGSIVYLGPLREYPERHYIFSGVSPTSVGKSGKYTSDLLFLNKDLTQKVNYWLNQFGIDYEMVVKRISDEDISDVYSMRLIDKKSNISVSPLDVGFGISQILPIIVQSLISKNSTILIEQPEIHIHPRLQTIFGTFLSECIKSGNQFIIETHSEHILLRIQKLVRQGLLNKDDVSIIYVDRQLDGSKCIEIRMNSKGEFLDSWPNGFFEEGYEEVFS